MTLQEGKGKKLYVVGNYRLSGKLLGKGNFARVEEALHTVLNVKVAVKIMDINQIKEDYVIRNLFREAKLMAKLNHPCICSLYQTMQQSDNVYYLVTELAPGGDLCTFVKEQRGGRLEERPARIYARQFVSALAHMHHIGVVHRDLKMENVMLNSARTQIKIVDFGLSNFYSPNEPLKTHCGSPEYAAPELFITGMKYGPEVDLWSLGIILYGMVVGQLPFVSNRNEQITSQERRKRLVAQINKGLGSSHKRTLSVFSTGFRNMVGRMLVPDISKRISIKELLTHPFITEKGTKFIRVSPMKKLDVRHQAGLIAQICEVTHQPSDHVIQLVKQEPFSRIGGMYNILAHRFALNQLSGDGITRILPALEVEPNKIRSPQDSPVKRPYNLRNLSSAKTPDSYTPKVIVQDRKLSSQHDQRTPLTPLTPQTPARPKTECRRPCTPLLGTRPRTVQPAKLAEKKVTYRDIKTPFMARKAYSAGITPKTTRPSTVASPVATKVSSTMNTRITRDVVKKLCPDDERPTARDGGELTPRSRNKQATVMLPNGLKIINKMEKPVFGGTNNRVQTAPLNPKQRSKSEKLPDTIRPATTSPGAIRQSIGTTKSDSKATTNRPMTSSSSKESRPFTRLLKHMRPATCGHPIEKSSMAYGDIAQRNHALYQKLKKPAIYDPIARSIADYVCNNVPNKLPTLSHFKK